MSDNTEAPKTALVVEGGGMRGIFSAGVLDTFLEQSFDPFDLYVGVSAGAGNIASHLAGQLQRSFRVYTNLMTRPEFISLAKFVKGGNYMDLDYLWDVIDKEDPLDEAAIFKRNNHNFTAVGTSAETGNALYIQPTPDNCSLVLKSSSAVPFLYRTHLVINGTRIVDGGVADPIPAEEAFRQGARRIVVIRSRPVTYRKDPWLENRLAAFATRDCPGLSQAIFHQPQAYSRCVDFLQHPPNATQVIQIAPPVQLKTGRTTQQRDALLTDYALGKALANAFIKDFKP